MRISSDAEVVFKSPDSQWDDEVVAEDECPGSKEVAIDLVQPTLYTADGKTEILELQPDLSVKIRAPEVSLLKAVQKRVLFLPDTSGSVAWDANGNDRSEIFRAIKDDLCEKLGTMQFSHFAICGFGGRKDRTPRLSKYPDSTFSGLYWAKATEENRKQAIAFVQNLRAGGGTPTYAALAEATDLKGPMICILYTDGVPTLGEGGQLAVLDFAKELADRDITINTVGVGALSAQNQEFDWSGAEFLARLAKATVGEYFALK